MRREPFEQVVGHLVIPPEGHMHVGTGNVFVTNTQTDSTGEQVQPVISCFFIISYFERVEVIFRFILTLLLPSVMGTWFKIIFSRLGLFI